MKLSSKGQYAIQAMIDIAAHCSKSKGPVSLREIALSQSIPLPFLEQIAIKLRRAGLVQSTRGPSGGYILAKDRKSISLADIIQAVEGTIDVAPNSSTKSEITNSLWLKVNREVFKILKLITLEDLYYDLVSLKASKENQYLQ